MYFSISLAIVTMLMKKLLSSNLDEIKNLNK